MRTARSVTSPPYAVKSNLIFCIASQFLMASSHIVFNCNYLDNITTLDKPKLITCGRANMDIPEMGSLNKVLEHLPLPKHGYYYDENIVANLLSLGIIANKFCVLMDIDTKDSIYAHGRMEGTNG